jgi:hypothetical protein
MGFDIGGAAALNSASGTALSMRAGATDWMSVNANGILTREQTPYMRGAFSGKGNPVTGVLLITADVNVGSCWNDSTGNFTCPVAGYYLVTGSNIAAVGSGYFRIRKNGASYHFTHWNHATPDWAYVSLSCIVLCAVGDTIQYFTESTNSGFYGGGGHCMYSIALMA